ncbi:MAG: hypothetical protein AAB267_05805, partial [Candidatus Desantisbacteria bacterium]
AFQRQEAGASDVARQRTEPLRRIYENEHKAIVNQIEFWQAHSQTREVREFVRVLNKQLAILEADVSLRRDLSEFNNLREQAESNLRSINQHYYKGLDIFGANSAEEALRLIEEERNKLIERRQDRGLPEQEKSLINLRLATLEQRRQIILTIKQGVKPSEDRYRDLVNAYTSELRLQILLQEKTLKAGKQGAKADILRLEQDIRINKAMLIAIDPEMQKRAIELVERLFNRIEGAGQNPWISSAKSNITREITTAGTALNGLSAELISAIYELDSKDRNALLPDSIRLFAGAQAVSPGGGFSVVWNPVKKVSKTVSRAHYIETAAKFSEAIDSAIFEALSAQAELARIDINIYRLKEKEASLNNILTGIAKPLSEIEQIEAERERFIISEELRNLEQERSLTLFKISYLTGEPVQLRPDYNRDGVSAAQELANSITNFAEKIYQARMSQDILPARGLNTEEKARLDEAIALHRLLSIERWHPEINIGASIRGMLTGATRPGGFGFGASMSIYNPETRHRERAMRAEIDRLREIIEDGSRYISLERSKAREEINFANRQLTRSLPERISLVENRFNQAKTDYAEGRIAFSELLDAWRETEALKADSII